MLEECRDESVNILKYDKICKHWCPNAFVLEFVFVLVHCRMKTLNSVIGSILKDGNPFSLNTLVFTSAIIGQGTAEQQEMWLERALNHKILGTYAQVRADVVIELN
jgi:hypothetical protein